MRYSIGAVASLKSGRLPIQGILQKIQCFKPDEARTKNIDAARDDICEEFSESPLSEKMLDRFLFGY